MNVSYFGDPNPRRAKPPAGPGQLPLRCRRVKVPELPVLPMTDGSLAALAPAILIDGPFCGGDTNQFDADLLRVRKVRVTLRMQVGHRPRSAAPIGRSSG